MSAKELKQNVFGDFIEWLEREGIGDHFSMDVWMSQVFGVLYHRYLDHQRRDRAIAEFAETVPPEILEKIAADKRAKEKPLQGETVVETEKIINFGRCPK